MTSKEIDLFRKVKLLFQSMVMVLIFCIVSSLSISAVLVPGFEIDQDLKIARHNLFLLEPVFVERVYDGDTFLTSDGREVRLIGVDCPEMNYEEGIPEYYAPRIRSFVVDQLQQKLVYLEYDRERKDKYGRYLAYVFLRDGTFFNALLLDKGYAHLLTVSPNNRYVDKYRELARRARKERRGIWTIWDEVKKKEVPLIPWKEAERYIGKEVIVSGRVVDTYNSGKTVFINFAEDYQQTLSLVIFQQDLREFDYKPVEYLFDKQIMVRGVIKEYKGAPEIIVEDPLQIIVKFM